MTLWTAAEIAAACGGEARGEFSADGVTFDSREVGPRDLFIALEGASAEGHDFVAAAFARGAAGALVAREIEGPHVRVADTMRALEDLGRAARARAGAKVIGVTGSVGKTGTKEALFAALDRDSPGAAHRSVRSYNNHTGVPLSLARMPRGARYAVLEMGMNHAGELAALTALVRPHVALVTTIAPAHSEFFDSEEAIADAKAEIFAGLVEGGTAIVPFDSPHRDRLAAAAGRHAGRILTFGLGDGADVHAAYAIPSAGGGTLVTATLPGGQLSFTLGQPGDHWVANALAVLAAVEAVGADLGAAGLALAEMGGLPGRGARHNVALNGGEALLIDESYNANPASMAATLKMLGETVVERRIAVLGTMRELGEQSERFHAGLAGPLLDARVELAILVGAEMVPLVKALGRRIEVSHCADAQAALRRLREVVAPGDAILVKGSNAMGLARLVAALTGGDD